MAHEALQPTAVYDAQNRDPDNLAEMSAQCVRFGFDPDRTMTLTLLGDHFAVGEVFAEVVAP